MSKLSIICPACSRRAEPERPQDWSSYNIVPVICKTCKATYWVPMTIETVSINTQPMINKPELPIELGTTIVVVLKEHQYYLKTGTVIDKTYCHYRIKIDGINLLMPENGIEEYYGR